MRFAVGYQLAEEHEESFVDVVRDYRDHIAEVYFPWGTLASGRAALTAQRGYVDWRGQQRLEADLRALRAMGVRLDLLFNANCYGEYAVSEHLQHQVMSVLDHLEQVLAGPVETVTTTSLTIARTVRRHAPSIDVRASVNMRIGTVQGMRYVDGLFTSYCVQRDYNRDLERLRELGCWAKSQGKGLSMLVNSGCLAFCSGQTFHDNLVAHDAGIDEMRNIPDWTPMVCWNLLRDREQWPAILEATWVRPEDLQHYDGMFDLFKLATRMHARPRLVIDAYVRRRFRGNLLDLLEPGYGPALAPYVIDNSRFPADWHERVTVCRRACERCSYCRGVLEKVLLKAE